MEEHLKKELETAYETIEQLQQYKQQINELIKKYEHKISDDGMTIKINDNEKLKTFQEIIDDLSKLKERDEK